MPITPHSGLCSSSCASGPSSQAPAAAARAGYYHSAFSSASGAAEAMARRRGAGRSAQAREKRAARREAPLLRTVVALLLLAVADAADSFSKPINSVSIPIVEASACANGQAQRPCTTMERISGGRTSSSTCPCPYLDGVTGGPGPVRRFTLVVQHLIRPSLVAGLDKVHVTVNGTIPGPPIVVNAGDWLEISVVNNLPNEPTILHFHGQLQVMTPSQGGVVALTQCAIQPGKTLVYSFRASNGEWGGGRKARLRLMRLRNGFSASLV